MSHLVSTYNVLGLMQGTGFNCSTLRAHSNFTWGVCAHALLSLPGTSFPPVSAQVTPTQPPHLRLAATPSRKPFLTSSPTVHSCRLLSSLPLPPPNSRSDDFCIALSLSCIIILCASKKEKMLPIKLNMTACLFFPLPHQAAGRILVPQPGTEPMSPAVEAQSLNH